MNSVALLGKRVFHRFLYVPFFLRKFCEQSFGGDNNKDYFDLRYDEEPFMRVWKDSDFDSYGYEGGESGQFSGRQRFVKNAIIDARRVLDILRQDGPGFDSRIVLNDLDIRVSGILVREVLLGILRNINGENKTRSAKLGGKFFVWSGQRENYSHTANAYHLIMEIFAKCEEFKAMWRLVDEMIENGFPTTARTFNILISTCSEVGLARNVVERFVRSKSFNYRPFKHSYNAILHSLLLLHHHDLIEWVHEQMLSEGYSPDVLTYNVLICAKYRLGKLKEFHRLLDEMCRSGYSPDFHTYNILLHYLGKGNKPIAALNLLNHMKEVGFEPGVLQFTTLIDGLGHAGNLEACKYFFDEMIKNDCAPDTVCYTVMIMAYMMAGELDKAQEMFNEMIVNGQLPNVFTYHSMIRGFCMAGKFKEAHSMLKEMETRGCHPNFFVYKTLISSLRNEGKFSEACEVIKDMVEKGKYAHLASRFKGYRRE